MKLNLEYKTKEQELVKAYLEENVSETLANKINNGIKTIKNEKELRSKKDLEGFFKYANNEAKKLAEKGANCACVEDKVVFGWAIHYFEEDTIEGTLYNLDGTEYKEVKPKPETKPIEKTVVKKEEPQISFFDLDLELDKDSSEPIKEENEEDIEEPEIDLDSAINGQILTDDGEYINFEEFDGDIQEEPNKKIEFNNDLEIDINNLLLNKENPNLEKLRAIFGTQLEVKL